MKWWGLLIIVTACQNTTGIVYQRGDLKDQVLKPRNGHKNFLTNQLCAEYKPGTKDCVKWDLIEYDLQDHTVRDRLRALKFQCKYNNERFRICEKSRGICQQTVVKGGWFKPDQIVLTDYLSFDSDYQKLVDAKLECASQDSIYGRNMFKGKSH